MSALNISNEILDSPVMYQTNTILSETYTALIETNSTHLNFSVSNILGKIWLIGIIFFLYIL